MSSSSTARPLFCRHVWCACVLFLSGVILCAHACSCRVTNWDDLKLPGWLKGYNAKPVIIKKSGAQIVHPTGIHVRVLPGLATSVPWPPPTAHSYHTHFGPQSLAVFLTPPLSVCAPPLLWYRTRFALCQTTVAGPTRAHPQVVVLSTKVRCAWSSWTMCSSPPCLCYKQLPSECR